MSERTWAVCMFWMGFVIGMLFVGALISITDNLQDEVDPADAEQIESNLRLDARLDALDKEREEALENLESLEELSAVLDRLEEEAKQ